MFYCNCRRDLTFNLWLVIVASWSLCKPLSVLLTFWRGRRPHSFSIEFSPKFSPILAKILVIWIFYWIFAKFFTNFGENFGELKNLVSFWVTKMSPILVTIIPPNFVLFLSPILAKISVNWRIWWVFEWQKCHQFWWQ